jgi:hypothetical protein
MSTDTDTLRDELTSEFTLARMNRIRALIQLERRDSPENRDAYAAAGMELDAVLDMWNEARGDCE